MTGSKDPAQRLIEWYNQDRMHMSLGGGTDPGRSVCRKGAPGRAKGC